MFDGHGGDQTSKRVEVALHPKIFLTEEFAKGDVDRALERGFEEMDKEVVEEANKNNLMNGSTCVVGLILDGALHIANIGDSEGVLVSVENDKLEAINLTKPHKASDPVEKERVEGLGGYVFFGRVFGALAVSRSFGDAKYKKPKTTKDFVSWEPFLKKIELQNSHKYMVLACDGLWDVMKHDEVAELTHKLFQEGKSPDQVAEQLVKTALYKKTDDNVTVVVVKIDWEQSGQNKEASTNNHNVEVPQPKKGENPDPIVSGDEFKPEVKEELKKEAVEEKKVEQQEKEQEQEQEKEAKSTEQGKDEPKEDASKEDAPKEDAPSTTNTD